MMVVVTHGMDSENVLVSSLPEAKWSHTSVIIPSVYNPDAKQKYVS